MEITLTNEHVIIKAPRIKAPSKSGKSILLATSNGNMTTTTVVDGKPVVIGLNVYITK